MLVARVGLAANDARESIAVETTAVRPKIFRIGTIPRSGRPLQGREIVARASGITTKNRSAAPDPFSRTCWSIFEGSQPLDPKVPELHLHRRAHVDLHAQQAFHLAVLFIVVDDAAHEVAV